MGALAPVLGLFIFHWTKFAGYPLKTTFSWMFFHEPGFKTLTAALSLSLLLNALMFTLYINNRKDKTAKGIFATTLAYGLGILIIKTFL